MTDFPSEDPNDFSKDPPARHERGEVATPRWVKVFGIVAFVFVEAFVILHLAGGGFRGHGSP
jgi:hypothetical protein